MPHQRTTEKFDINDVLCQNKFCESLTINEINTFLEFTEAVSFKKGDVIADIGDIGDALFFVIEGITGLFHENQGKEVEIGELEGTRTRTTRHWYLFLMLRSIPQVFLALFKIYHIKMNLCRPCCY